MIRITLKEAVKIIEREKKKKQWREFQKKCPVAARLLWTEHRVAKKCRVCEK